MSGCITIVAVLCACFTSARVSAATSSERYTWRNVAIGGGGFVTGIIVHPTRKDLFYARTDVGGAYRWDADERRWIPLTDWIGLADVNLTGIESLAVDPSDASRVYLAAGTYSQNAAAILRSDDQGRTFQRIDVPFRMGANEIGRANGERLAVDPHRGEILFFGSRRDGLWKSVDRAATWRKVEGFPWPREPGAIPRADAQPPVGIVCVMFDPAIPTAAIYAAVSATGTNLFRSTDAGATWQAVPGQPANLRPNHVVRGTDGMLYLSYGAEPGPNTMTDGAVWKFNPKTADWTDITPLRSPQDGQTFGYGAVSVDARNPATLMVTTFCRWRPHDEVFRSTNGGASWIPLLARAQWDYSSAPYTSTRTPHWMGDIEINPSNPDQVLFTTGYGIWSSGNATEADAGRPTRWTFFNRGLEETVPLALISPPEGAHLLSGLGDIDGFRHEDLGISPVQGSFAGPRFSNTEDLAFAGRAPEVIVRCGTGRAAVRAAISLDGGKSWSALRSEPPGSTMGAGNIAVSADGKTIVWTPRRGMPYRTVDQGTNWTVCGGLSSGSRVVADPVNASRFYAFESRTGRLLGSNDGGKQFLQTEASLPRMDGPGAGGALLSVTPDREGDLWLAFRDHGLHRSTNAGASFEKVAPVQRADSLGFGKAATGREFPALFLVGRVDQRQAVFRSDDAGATWVRLTDDQHQFGWIGRVTGDPRIYGRVYVGTGGRGIVYGDAAEFDTAAPPVTQGSY